ncbi:TPA: capsid protein [Streptococcus suis]|nr:capsid protein [Streptococcus suis]
MIDKRLLTDSLTVRLKDGKNEFGDESYGQAFTLSPVRFDRSVSVVGSSNSKSRLKHGRIFVYSRFVQVRVDDTWLEGIVSDGQREYIIKGFETNFLNGRLFGYEIEVQ